MSPFCHAARSDFQAFIATILLLSQAAALQAAEVFEVTKTFDNHPLTCRIESARKSDAYEVYRLHYPSPVQTKVESNNTIPAELYMPRGVKAGGM